MSITKRLCLWTVLVVVGVMSIACVMVYGSMSAVLERRAMEDQQSIVQQCVGSMENLLSELLQINYYLSGDKLIPQLLAMNPETENDRLNWQAALQERFYAYTSAPITAANLEYFSVLFIDNQYAIAKSLPENDLTDFSQSHAAVARMGAIAQAPWFEPVIQKNGALGSFLIPGMNYVYFANLQHNVNAEFPDYHDVMGLTVYAIKQRSIEGFLKSARMTPGTVLLFLQDDLVLSSTDRERFAAGTRLGRAYPEITGLGYGQELSDLTIDGAGVWATKSRLMRDWQLVAMIPKREILSHLSETVGLLLMAMGVLTILGIGIAIYVSRKFTGPIVALSRTMQGYGKKNSLPEIGKGQDEMRLLYDSYQLLVNRVEELLQEKDDTYREKRQADLKALQAQINPHFVYNTLDSINCIALINGQDEINQMVSNLTDILKYSIRFSRYTVPIEEEISFLQKYLEIQRLRYQGNFDFINEVPGWLYGEAIPQMTLQPLVENCFYHAMSSCGRLRIRLSAGMEGDRITMTVWDNGAKGDSEALNRYLACETPLQGTPSALRDGIGIRNVNQRIQMYFGLDCGLHFEKGPDGGTGAVVTLRRLKCAKQAEQPAFKGENIL